MSEPIEGSGMMNNYESCTHCSASGMVWNGDDVRPCPECKGDTIVPCFVPHDQLTPGYWYVRGGRESGYQIVEILWRYGKLLVVNHENRRTYRPDQYEENAFIGKVPEPDL